MKNHRRRRPRFRRATTERWGLRLTPRDRQLIRWVARHRFLRSSHLTALAGGSQQQVLRRLQRLFHHGYLERPRAQLADLRFHAGSQALIYALGKKGAVLLREEGFLERGRLEWRANDSGTRLLFMAHALGVADFMVALELDCRRRPGLELRAIDGALIDDRSPPPVPTRWRVQLANGDWVGVVPDAAFRLRDDSGEVVFFLEFDRGTMPVRRRDSTVSSFAKKLQAYAATWEQGLQQLEFGVGRFRVLTVTTGEPRIRSIIEAARELPRGRGLFLIRGDVSAGGSGEILGAHWRPVAGGDLEALMGS